MASRFLKIIRRDIFSPNLSWFEKLNKVWDYFKRGNSEIRQFWGIWNFILLLAIKLDITLTWIMILGWTVLFIPVCIGMGLFFTKKVNITSHKTNPYTQDSIQGSLNLLNSMNHLYEFQKTGNKDQIEKAIEEMNKAILIKEKWVNR